MQARDIRQAIFIGGLFLLTCLVYYGALGSHFWGDDYYNLYGLELIETNGYSNFIFNGIAGPSGRPLSLLSFALQHESWPNNPFSFKLANLCLHLLNGLLIYLIGKRVVTHLPGMGAGRGSFPLVVTALWLLHPLQISTVLYAVQRMTQLAVFFTLAGILGYLVFRGKYLLTGRVRGLLYMGLAVGAGTIFGVLSKEIAILLPLYILILECTLLAGISRDIRFRWWAGLFLVAPLFLLMGYLTLHFPDTQMGYQSRHFTMSERLLTQPMVLFDYLAKILLPIPGVYSIFNDDFPVVSGLLQPPSAIIYLLGIAGMLGLGLYWRRRRSVIGFAILWFLGGHALESSFISLELYFEHRNYLPLLGPCVLVAWVVSCVHGKYGRNIGYTTALIILVYLGLISARETASYENPYAKAVERVVMQPASARAWSYLMDLQVAAGGYDRFTEGFREATSKQNHALLLYVKKIHATACHFHREVPVSDWDALFANLNLDEWSVTGTIGSINDLVEAMLHRDCQGVNPYRLMGLIIRLTEQPRYQRYRGMLHELATLICIHIGDSGCALANIRQAVHLSPHAQRYELQLNLLIALEDTEAAQSTLVAYKDYLNRNPGLKLAYRDSLAALEQSVMALAGERHAEP